MLDLRVKQWHPDTDERAASGTSITELNLMGLQRRAQRPTMPLPMIALPIDDFLPDVARSLRGAPNLVLVAEPGAGKTTRVPPAILPLLDAGEHPNIVMLQPRRVAARAAAMRIAAERGWIVGKEVGYHIRFDRMIGRDTRLRVLTEGILTRQLLSDAFLPGIGCVILDEFHERSIHIDLALAMLREVQQTVRPDLRIIVMSATLDAEPVAAFLGGAPVVRVPGRLFPIQIDHRPVSRDRYIDETVAETLGDVLRQPAEDRGDILIFLPGAGEINRTGGAIAKLADEHNLAVLPLHGSLPNDEQLRALLPNPRRKVILATNIAETSLTIDGVTLVIDTGLHRLAGYDAQRGMDTLSLARISQASATQRAGRAGRTRPGRAIRLWSEKEHHTLDKFDTPELSRVDLATTVLSLHAWGCDDPRTFAYFQPPPEHMLASAERLLAMLGALDAPQRGKLTSLGRQMLAFPAHPRIARLLLASRDIGMPEEGALVAALLSERDILRDAPGDSRPRLTAAPTTRADCDMDVRLQLLQTRTQDDRLDFAAVQQVRRAAEQFLTLAWYPGRGQGEGSPANDDPRRIAQRPDAGHKPTPSASPQEPSPRPSPGAPAEGVRKLLLLAYPDRVCRLRDREKRTGTMVGGGGVRLAPESGVVDADLFVAIDTRHNPAAARAESIVRIACRIEPQWLSELLPQSVTKQIVAEYDQSRERVIGASRTMYADLVIDEQLNAPVDDATAAQVLAEALAPRAVALLERDEAAANFLARLDLLRRHMPEHPWPTLQGPGLVEIVRDACAGKRSLASIDSSSLLQALRARLIYPLDRLLDQHAPDTIEVPTGNRIRLTYIAGQSPRLAVRLQELFGLAATPLVCGGRVPVVLELLGPNYRPAQVTEDLASFWKNTYPQVRKDLRARYPKHSWPDDPLTAPPQAKGRRRT